MIAAADQHRLRLPREQAVGPIPGVVVQHFKDREEELRITKFLHDLQRDCTLQRCEATAAIARAILCDAPLLLLDEPTSAVDAETEAPIMAGLEQLMGSRTTFIIAHRLSTVQRADMIIVEYVGNQLVVDLCRYICHTNYRSIRDDIAMSMEDSWYVSIHHL